jgi:hypothetical protein
MVTKLGQKPSIQVWSWLQEDWSMRRFWPNGVATGSTAMQLETAEQSPQSSQTRSLMKTREVADAARPRFLRRRSSVAQGWS